MQKTTWHQLEIEILWKTIYPKIQWNILYSDYMSTLRGNNTFCVLTELSKAKAMLWNIRHDIDSITLKAIYHAIIESHLYYSSLVWAKTFVHLKKESFNKKLQLVRFTDNFFFGSCFRLEFFSSNKFICTVILLAILFMLAFSCLIGVSPSSKSDTSANQRIFFRNNLFK